MNTKFIKLTIGSSGEEHYVNPLFIVSIRKVGSTERCVVYTMGGHTINPNETTEEVMKMIKSSERYLTFFKDLHLDPKFDL